ncbi:MAG TPA: ThiF family adenylyltransferase [Candidatus Aquicultor sp.]|jgi:molybdopterin/thiamine biosynthesis adenylyltransferase
MHNYNEMVQRNRGLIIPEHQERLRDLKVAIAGVGGVGGITAERLVRLGIGTLHIADPELFEIGNANRQLLANQQTIGQNKALMFESELLKINPHLNLKVWEEGISEQNVGEFLNGADIVIDAIEYNRPDLSVMLNKASREAGKTVLIAFAIGFGATMFAFNANGIKFEDYIGLPANASPEEVEDYIIPLDRFCPEVPKYVEMNIIEKVVRREMHIPTSSLGCLAAASLLVAGVIMFIIDNKRIPVAPKYLAVDFYNMF